MGLDMYAFATDAAIPPVDFKAPDDQSELHYWRKHPNLHGWMRNLYRDKGGDDADFNCVPVRLDASDLDALEDAIKRNELPETHGFFFGESDGSEKTEDLQFIHKAREALAEDRNVYYWSWW
jgi:hypothetical protein